VGKHDAEMLTASQTKEPGPYVVLYREGRWDVQHRLDESIHMPMKTAEAAKVIADELNDWGPPT
jgi:hypothetical protein